MTTQSDNTLAQQRANIGYITDSIMRLRLETQGVLDQIEAFLRGSQLIPREIEGQGITMQKLKIGEPLVNDLGVQSIMSRCHSIINPQVVQGNLSDKMYENYIYEINLSLIRMIIINSDNWQIQDENIEPITDFIMDFVQLFASRTIDNEERNSYGATFKTLENNTIMQKSLPFGSNKR